MTTLAGNRAFGDADRDACSAGLPVAERLAEPFALLDSGTCSSVSMPVRRIVSRICST